MKEGAWYFGRDLAMYVVVLVPRMMKVLFGRARGRGGASPSLHKAALYSSIYRDEHLSSVLFTTLPTSAGKIIGERPANTIYEYYFVLCVCYNSLPVFVNVNILHKGVLW